MPGLLAIMAAIALFLFLSATPSGSLAETVKRGDNLAETGRTSDNLAGAWRGKVQFKSGALADTKDLEFMYAFNAGGTMTESSNYDAAPPVPPAYGAWKKVGARKYEARYEFFQSTPATTADELVNGGGWAPGGYGILSEKITLSADGNSFDSRITLELFDKQGKTATGGGEGAVRASRMPR